jgi:small subunit ribosomal protein S20
MPNLENAKKALRQNKKRADRNKIVNAELKSLRVKLRKMIDSKNLEQSQEVAKLVCKKLDKAQQKKVLKKNTVARYKSRLMKKVNALKSA